MAFWAVNAISVHKQRFIRSLHIDGCETYGVADGCLFINVGKNWEKCFFFLNKQLMSHIVWSRFMCFPLTNALILYLHMKCTVRSCCSNDDIIVRGWGGVQGRRHCFSASFVYI